MRSFEVLVTARYKVMIKATNVEDAESCAAYFLSAPKDSSTTIDREKERFQIMWIEKLESYGERFFDTPDDSTPEEI